MLVDNRCMTFPPPETLARPGEPPPVRKSDGLPRLWHATRNSWQGLRAGWAEPAFRQEAFAAAVLVPAAFWVGRGWVEVALLVASVLLVMIVELLNTAVETVVDRVGPEWHALSGRAKDLGSAAVMLSLLLAACVWIAVIAERVTG